MLFDEYMIPTKESSDFSEGIGQQVKKFLNDNYNKVSLAELGHFETMLVTKIIFNCHGILRRKRKDAGFEESWHVELQSNKT